jgi:DNA-binding NarL/FixJ family response regulator
MMADTLIVDDHQLLATALVVTLDRVGIAAAAVRPRPRPELLRDLLDRRPGTVLLDLDLGEYGDATPLIAPLADAGTRVVVMTGLADRMRIAAALEQGALAFRSKADGVEALVDAVRRVRRSPEPLDPRTRVALLEELRRDRARRSATLAPFRRLTDREQETLRALADGCSVREIADRWVVSEATVRTHVRSLLGKLGARSQLAAVAMALRAGWLEPREPAVPAGG